MLFLSFEYENNVKRIPWPRILYQLFALIIIFSMMKAVIKSVQWYRVTSHLCAWNVLVLCSAGWSVLVLCPAGWSVLALCPAAGVSWPCVQQAGVSWPCVQQQECPGPVSSSRSVLVLCPAAGVSWSCVQQQECPGPVSSSRSVLALCPAAWSPHSTSAKQYILFFFGKYDTIMSCGGIFLVQNFPPAPKLH